MKNWILIGLTLAVFTSCDQKDPNAELNSAKKFYEVALDNNDMTTARIALTQLTILDSENTAYQDSLARLYIRAGNYKGGIKLAEEIQAKNKADEKLKAMLGLSYQSNGELSKANDMFKGLYAETKDANYYFQMASIAAEQGDKPSLDSITNNLLELCKTDTAVAGIGMPFPTANGQSQQLVPMKAAVYFLKGSYAAEIEGNYSVAVNHFVASIQAFEPFELPRYMLQQIEYANTQRR